MKSFIGHYMIIKFLKNLLDIQIRKFKSIILCSIHWIDLSPVSDDFLSCSMDGTLRLWNLTSES